MKKKYALYILLALVMVGSFVNYWTTNLWLDDVANLFGGGGIITSIPGMMFALYFVLGTLYIIRICIKPQYKKRITNLYTIIAAAFGFLGFITSILAGVLFYKSFTKPYPFPGYLIIGMIVHILMMGAAIFLNIFARKKMPTDTERRKMSVRYVIYTIIVSILIYASYNRFGALLWGPSYIEWSTVYMTWPFYTSMLLPLAMLATVASDMFGFHRRNKLISVVYSMTITILNIIFAAIVIIIGTSDSRFISIISPVLPLERLIALPVEIILQYGAMTIFGVYLSVGRFIFYEKTKTGQATQNQTPVITDAAPSEEEKEEASE